MSNLSDASVLIYLPYHIIKQQFIDLDKRDMSIYPSCTISTIVNAWAMGNLFKPIDDWLHDNFHQHNVILYSEMDFDVLDPSMFQDVEYPNGQLPFCKIGIKREYADRLKQEWEGRDYYHFEVT